MIATKYLLFATVAAFLAGWTIQGWRCEAGQKAAAEAALQARVAAEAAAAEHSGRLERRIAELDAARQSLTKRLNYETRNGAYRCPVPADGLRLLNEARTGHTAPGEPDRPLP